jgi:hypothetical protein
MDQSSLRQLAEQGIGRFPPVRLADLADWCQDFGEATGDARFCSLSSAIGVVVDLFESNSEQAPTALVEQLDVLLRQNMSAILDAETAEEGSLLSRQLREAIERTVDSSHPL